MRGTFIIPRDSEALRTALSALNDIHEVTLRPLKLTRSAAQNRLLHLWYREFGRLNGEHYGRYLTHDEVEEIFKRTFLPINVIEFDGKIIEILTKTSELDVEEMSEYLTNIDHFASADRGILLPHPDDYHIAMTKNE